MEDRVLAQYAEQVTVYMQRIYGLSWADACGDVAPLALALADGKDPAAFAAEFGERYDLRPIRPELSGTTDTTSIPKGGPAMYYSHS
jgi:hypothetical protein